MVNDGVTRWELEQLTVQGHPRDLGEQQGEHCRERIQQFIAVRFAAVSEYAAELGRDDITPLREIGRASQAIFADWDPEASTEHEGIARGAQVEKRLHGSIFPRPPPLHSPPPLPRP